MNNNSHFQAYYVYIKVAGERILFDFLISYITANTDMLITEAKKHQTETI